MTSTLRISVDDPIIRYHHTQDIFTISWPWYKTERFSVTKQNGELNLSALDNMRSALQEFYRHKSIAEAAANLRLAKERDIVELRRIAMLSVREHVEKSVIRRYSETGQIKAPTLEELGLAKEED